MLCFLISSLTVAILRSRWIVSYVTYQGGFMIILVALDWKRWSCSLYPKVQSRMSGWASRWLCRVTIYFQGLDLIVCPRASNRQHSSSREFCLILSALMILFSINDKYWIEPCIPRVYSFKNAQTDRGTIRRFVLKGDEKILIRWKLNSFRY